MATRNEIKVELRGVHLCCQGCVNAADAALMSVEGVNSRCDKTLKVSGIHNCCGPCCEAIKGAIATVDGVTGDTARPRATSFEVTGDFYAAALVRALNAAGFSAQVRQ
jgi:copper chaperone CopZ